MTDIEIRRISKTYPGATEPAVKDISLAVEKGTIVTLLGPSGCGKTTILRIIAGFERAEKGEVLLAGRQVSGVDFWIPPEKRGVGMVFQDYALFSHLNVSNNVGFGYKGSDRTERVKEVLELVNLIGYEKRFPHELSGGQQQRVALARALTRRPLVVLLDEPFSNLDADLRVQMRLELKRILKETGTTAVFVSHDQKDALAISDRIAVINGGTIQQIGSPREIYQYPANIFVATFVGQSNLLKGVMAADGESVITSVGPFPCRHTHGHRAGEEVHISIRPDGLEMAGDGHIIGTVKELTYTGESFDAIIEVEARTGNQDLLVHIHPEEDVKTGDLISFKVLPHFVAVVGPESPGADPDNGTL